MPTNLYGSNHLDQVRHSDYKNSTMAMCEIIDNAIDAGAQKIVVTLVRDQSKIDSIYFFDNGQGFTTNSLAKCLVLSHSGSVEGSIGKFGMGLPNSSLSQAQRVDVVSKIDNQFMSVHVDIRTIGGNDNFLDDPIVCPSSVLSDFRKYSNGMTFTTAVRWSRLDLFDGVRPVSILNRADQLMGRIYRYALKSGLILEFNIHEKANSRPDPDYNKLLIKPFDPLFLSSDPHLVDELLKKEASNAEYNTVADELLRPSFYYKKLIQERKALPLFSEVLDEKVGVRWNGELYEAQIRVSCAKPEIQKPGTDKGGSLPIGQIMRQKHLGTKQFPSGNITFVRNGREVHWGNFGIANQEEKTRWWSVEILFSEKEDEFLGVSYTKQGVKWYPLIEWTRHPENASFADKREEFWGLITHKVKQGVRQATQTLSRQARDFKAWHKQHTGQGGGGTTEGPSPISTEAIKAIKMVLGEGSRLSDEEKKELKSIIRDLHPELDTGAINNSIEILDAIGLDNILLYTTLGNSEELLRISELVDSRALTFINKDHPLNNLIEYFREKDNDEAIIGIELLLSSLTWASYQLRERGPMYREFIDKLIKDFGKELYDNISARISENQDLIPK